MKRQIDKLVERKLKDRRTNKRTRRNKVKDGKTNRQTSTRKVKRLSDQQTNYWRES